MNRYKGSRTIIINSSNRASGSDSNFTYHIDELTKNKYNRCCLIKALIPRSYYLVEEGINDSFTLTENGTDHTVTIAEGNYSLVSMRIALQQALNDAGSYTYAVSYPAKTQVDTGKWTFSVSDNSSVQPIFTFAEKSLREICGFTVGSHQFTTNTLTSSAVIKLQKEDALKIFCNMVEFDILGIAFVTSDPSYSNTMYEVTDVEAQSKRLINNEVGTYNFYITDENNIEKEMNSQNIVLELLFWYESDIMDRVFVKMEEFMRYYVMNNPPNEQRTLNNI